MTTAAADTAALRGTDARVEEMPAGSVGTRGRLIDVHAHFVPEQYRAAAIAAGHGQSDGFPGFPAWSEAGMLEMMDRLGISTALLSISSPGVHFGNDKAAGELARIVNREGARLKAAHPTRFGHFASLPLPHVEGALREITIAFDELDADGIVIQSNNGGLYPGDPSLEPVFAELDRRSAVIFMHPTSPKCPCCSIGRPLLPQSILEFMFETTRAVTDLVLSGTLERYPNIKLIVPHGGATLPVLADRISLAVSILPALQLTPAAVMTSLSKLYFDMAGAPLPRQLPALRTFADPSRLLYGSDWPFTPEPAVASLLGRLEAGLEGEPDLLEAICRNNALSLFPRLTAL